jgi:hypothetical protein
MPASFRSCALALSALCFSSAATPPASWQLAGTTYNSAAFVDMRSVRGSGASKNFTALRISGQSAKNGWKTVVQKLSVDCDTRVFLDGGSRITRTDGNVVSYPGFGARQIARSSGIFFEMFEIVCAGRAGTAVSDPQQWTLRNFKVGS